MSCNDTNYTIFKGKEELISVRYKLEDLTYFDFNGCDVELLIGEIGTTDRQSWWTGIVYYSMLSVNIPTTTVVFTLTDTQTWALEVKSYEWRVKATWWTLTEPLRNRLKVLEVIV